MATYTTMKGTKYQLADTPFTKGGEGSIFDVTNVNGYVAKIFHSGKATTALERKLDVLLHSFDSEMRKVFVAPIDLLYLNGKFVGYIMQKVNNCKTFSNFYSENQRRDLPWSLFVEVAKMFAYAVSLIHKTNNVVIGDFNPENFLIDPVNKRLFAVDTDSYHVIGANGFLFRCEVSYPDNTAPELNGVAFDVEKSTFTKETDLFALAVIVFQLLMNGAHPFNADISKFGSKSSSRFQLDRNIQNGYLPWFPDNIPLQARERLGLPDAAPDIDAIPRRVQELFRRAFVDGHKKPNSRPSAAEWYDALNSAGALKHCSEVSEHEYYAFAFSCPWCLVDKKIKETNERIRRGESRLKPVTPPPVPQGWGKYMSKSRESLSEKELGEYILYFFAPVWTEMQKATFTELEKYLNSIAKACVSEINSQQDSVATARYIQSTINEAVNSVNEILVSTIVTQPYYSYERLDTKNIISNILNNLQNRFAEILYDKIFEAILTVYSSTHKVNSRILTERWNAIKNNGYTNQRLNTIDRYISDADYYSMNIATSISDGIFSGICEQLINKFKR
ncbi:hypothetical protein FACS1894219_04500 [Clostridia bacterium]|nr:hypothetical protein FACS1894219_04500 [Clostridia bacterium]